MAFGSTSNKPANAEETRSTGKAPVAKKKYGGITVDVWENSGQNGSKFYTYTIQRSYKQGNDWKNTNSLRTQDLPKVILALQKVYEESFESEQDSE